MKHKVIDLKIEDILDLIEKQEIIVSDWTKTATIIELDNEIIHWKQKISRTKKIDILIEKLREEKFKINRK